MCFSATASFTAAGTLSLIGLLSLFKARKSTLLVLATMPLWFAAQQFCEGMLWLSLPVQNYHLIQYFLVLYVFFAYMWWPFFIPFSLACAERMQTRRNLLWYIFCIAIIFDVGLIYFWYAGDYYNAIASNHIQYIIPQFDYPPISFFYCICTIVPFFVSSRRFMWILGCAMAGSMIVSWWFFEIYFTSVWCFFAALISGLLLVVI